MKETLLRDDCKGGLYPLKLSRLPSLNKATHAAVMALSSRWHSRLGHPSSAIVSQVLSKSQIPFVSKSKKNSVCDACQKGKSHQLPYPRAISVSSSPFELVFSDVWGPAPTSVGKNDFYVSFIDDYSKFTWIYLLRHKSEVFQKIHEFQAMIERQFNKKILAMQTDWGGEYQKLNSFFQRIGIVHHVSCPHTHQQNGSAERKHRHIVEVGLTLLAHASMPLKFWDEAFVTATYLINRLPSKVISGDTPIERLFNQKPDYLSLRTFGCACWPHLCPYNARKLQFRSKQCVFLGYSNLHKGFKCLDVSEGRVYISRDVIFDENVYPFASMHPNAGARLKAKILLLPTDLLNPSSDFGVTILCVLMVMIPCALIQLVSMQVLHKNWQKMMLIWAPTALILCSRDTFLFRQGQALITRMICLLMLLQLAVHCPWIMRRHRGRHLCRADRPPPLCGRQLAVLLPTQLRRRGYTGGRTQAYQHRRPH